MHNGRFLMGGFFSSVFSTCPMFRACVLAVGSCLTRKLPGFSPWEAFPPSFFPFNLSREQMHYCTTHQNPPSLPPLKAFKIFWELRHVETGARNCSHGHENGTWAQTALTHPSPEPCCWALGKASGKRYSCLARSSCSVSASAAQIHHGIIRRCRTAALWHHCHRRSKAP